MVTNLKALIIQQIKSVYGTGTVVYDEPIRQGLKTPSFLLLIADTNQTTGLNEINREYVVNVNYFPLSIDERRSECEGVLETFLNEFRYIGTKHHAHSIEGIVSDDVLVITFNVKVMLKDVVVGTKMNTLGGVTVG